MPTFDLPQDLHRARRQARALRWNAANLLRDLARSADCPSVSLCRCRAIEGDAPRVTVREGGGASWSGLQRCKNPWSCPLCAQDKGEARSAIMLEAQAAATGAAVDVDMVTLTVPHERTDALADVLDDVLRSWSKLWQSTTFRERWHAAGGIGAVRAVEATYTRTAGWHVHLHVGVWRESGSTEPSAMIRAAWLAQDAARSPLGQHVTTDTSKLWWYLGAASTSWGLGAEVAKGVSKVGGASSLAPMEIAERAARGDRRCRTLWSEWCRATKGRRAWHVIARKRLESRLGVSLAEPEGDATEAQDVAVFSAECYAEIRKRRAQADVLRIEEDRPGAAAMLAQLGADDLAQLLVGRDWQQLARGLRVSDAERIRYGPPLHPE